MADESEPLIDKVISAVKGGSPKSAAAMKSGLSKDVVLNWSHYVEWAATLSDLPALIHSDVNTLLDWKTVFAGSYVPLLTFILCRSLNFLNCILYYFRLISLSACIVCFFLAGGGGR